MSARRATGGSRFLYDSFDLAQAQMEAQERVEQERRAGLEYRLSKIEGLLERVEKRLWLTVYGIAAGVLAQAALALIGAATGGSL